MLKETFRKMLIDARYEWKPADVMYGIGLVLIVIATAMLEGGLC